MVPCIHSIMHAQSMALCSGINLERYVPHLWSYRAGHEAILLVVTSKGEWHSDSRVHTTPSLLDIDEHYGDQLATQHPAPSTPLRSHQVVDRNCYLLKDLAFSIACITRPWSWKACKIWLCHVYILSILSSQYFTAWQHALGSGKASRGSHTIQVANWNPRRTQSIGLFCLQQHVVML